MTDTLEPPALPKRFWTDRSLSLHVVGPAGAHDLVLDRPFARIGSHPDAELCVTGPGIERRHAYLHLAEEGVYCLDFVAGQIREKQIGFWVDSQQPILIGAYQVFVRIVLPSGQTEEVDLPIAETGNPRLPGLAPTVSPIRSRRQPRFRLQDRFTCIGRLPGNLLRKSSGQLSQFHCVVVRHGDQLWLIDLLTTNGSSINGQATNVGVIPAPESEVVLAGTRLRFTLPPSQKPVSAGKPQVPDNKPQIPTANPGLDLARQQAVPDAREATLRVMTEDLNSLRDICEHREWERERKILSEQLAAQDSLAQQLAAAEANLKQALEQQQQVISQQVEQQQVEYDRLQEEWQSQEAELNSKLAEQARQLAAQTTESHDREQELLARLADAQHRETELAAWLEQQQVEYDRMRPEWERQETELRKKLAEQSLALESQTAEWHDREQNFLARLAEGQKNEAALAERVEQQQAEHHRQRSEWERREAELQASVTENRARLERVEQGGLAELAEMENRLTAERERVTGLQRQVEELNSQVAAVAANRPEEVHQESSSAEALAAELADRDVALQAREEELQQRELEFVKSRQHLEKARLFFEREMLIHGSQVKVLAKLGQLESEKTWLYRLFHPFRRS